HLQRQAREAPAASQRRRQPGAALHLLGGGVDVGGQRAVAQHVAADPQRRQQRHAVAQQRAQGARQARGLQPRQQRADELPFQHPFVEARAEPGVAQAAVEPQQRQQRQRQQQQPPVTHQLANAQHQAGEQRQVGVQAFVHRRELRQDRKSTRLNSSHV